MIKRLFDILLSLPALLILLPFMLIISIWIIVDSRGGAFYRQQRVGRHNRNFSMLKFRSMHPGADRKGLLTVGGRDPRITRAGYFLRKAKLDELPQLFNILAGQMSIVGPRPEVRKYVDLYNEDQMKVLDVRPGLTDYASLEYINESEILSQHDDPEKAYIEVIMPAKLELNLKYIRERTMGKDVRIILQTLGGMFK
jgi:lipopolysaccharide/colanic/teichoic acid biosynthesis glycosyltransferase